MVELKRKLVRDVVNPKPDRRSKYDWRCRPVIKAGKKVVLFVERIPVSGAKDVEIVKLGYGRWPISQTVTKDHPLFNLMMEASEELPTSAAGEEMNNVCPREMSGFIPGY